MASPSSSSIPTSTSTPSSSSSNANANPNANPNVTARVYTELGSWGMPTIDPEGLSALALLRFSDIPITLTSGASKSMTSSNVLPVTIFKTSSHQSQPPKLAAGLAQLIGLLSSDTSLPDPNASLTPFMVAESTAFISLLQSRFGPTRLHELFRLERNYADIYHTLIEKERNFPLNRILPRLRRNEILSSLKNRSNDSLYFDSNIALTALSTRLGSRKLFYDSKTPSVLDAVAFGYLASVLYTPLAVSTLRVQISKFKNLVDFTNRIADIYFKDSDVVGINNGIAIGQDVKDRVNHIKVDDDGYSNASERSRRATQGAPADDVEALSAEEKERKKWNSYFLWGSVAMFATHLLIGNEIEFDFS